jgi:hypothetical protein
MQKLQTVDLLTATRRLDREKRPIQGRGVGVRSKSGQRSANVHSAVHFHCAPTWSYFLQAPAVGQAARWSLAMASLAEYGWPVEVRGLPGLKGETWGTRPLFRLTGTDAVIHGAPGLGHPRTFEAASGADSLDAATGFTPTPPI